jgi:hypothetical protein
MKSGFFYVVTIRLAKIDDGQIRSVIEKLLESSTFAAAIQELVAASG